MAARTNQTKIPTPPVRQTPLDQARTFGNRVWATLLVLCYLVMAILALALGILTIFGIWTCFKIVARAIGLEV